MTVFSAVLKAGMICYNWLVYTERKDMPEHSEENFTHVIQTAILEFIEKYQVAGKAVPNIVRMEDNRILWQFAKTSMSITINDVSSEYTP